MDTDEKANFFKRACNWSMIHAKYLSSKCDEKDMRIKREREQFEDLVVALNNHLDLLELSITSKSDGTAALGEVLTVADSNHVLPAAKAANL